MTDEIRCPCGGIIIADTEDWEIPLCPDCYYKECAKIPEMKKRIKEFEKGYYGNPCENHQNIAAYMAQCKVDDEGLHCFGCFLETREKVAVEKALKEAKMHFPIG